MRIKQILPQPDDREPIGIVIADGGRGDANATRFSAFVWGPVPDDEEVRDPRTDFVAAHA